MPFPLNHSTNLFCTSPAFGSRTGASAAYAVPIELNIDTRGGMPTITGTWAAVSPRRKILRERRLRLVIICDIGNAPCFCNFGRSYQFDQQVFEVIARLAKTVHSLFQHRSVRWSIQPAGHIPENLFDDTFLTLRCL